MFPGETPVRLRPVIESPCNRVCTLDPDTDQCLGCGRSLAEIMAWTRMSEAERARIMDDCKQRLARRRAAS
jgi:predicted Fe-S protein YdhL (DUF1289 family)